MNKKQNKPKEPKSPVTYAGKSLSDFTKAELIKILIKMDTNRNLRLGKL